MRRARERAATTAPPSIQEEFGDWTPDDLISAGKAFDEANGGLSIDSYNALAAVATFFDAQADGLLPTGALVTAALEGLKDHAVNGEATERQVRGLARARLGTKDTKPLDMGRFAHAGLFAPKVYQKLPEPLAACCNTYEATYERDLFLLGALGILQAAQPRTRFVYDRFYGVNDYYCVVARTGSGKGVLADAAALSLPIDEYLEAQSEVEISRWNEAQKDEEEKRLLPREEPPWRRLLFAGDISGAELFLGLHANGGNGIIFETEIGVLLDTMGKEWGDVRSKLLKGWPNEWFLYQRKGLRPLRITEPTISIVVSGTHRMFIDFVKGTEDGFFTRFSFYTFKGSRGYEDRWQQDTFEDKTATIDRLAALYLDLFKAQANRPRRDDSGRPKDLFVTFSKRQQRAHYLIWRSQKRALQEHGFADIDTYVHRLALKPLRMAAALTVLRLAEDGKEDRITRVDPSVECNDDDFSIANQICLTLLAHGALMSEILPGARSRDEGNRGAARPEPGDDQARFYAALVEKFELHEFRRAEAVALHEEMPFGSRMADEYLKQLTEAGLLRKPGKQGIYQVTGKGPLFEKVEQETLPDPYGPIGYAPPDLVWPQQHPGTMHADLEKALNPQEEE